MPSPLRQISLCNPRPKKRFARCKELSRLRRQLKVRRNQKIGNGIDVPDLNVTKVTIVKLKLKVIIKCQ
jgi:hypothetical protein